MLKTQHYYPTKVTTVLDRARQVMIYHMEVPLKQIENGEQPSDDVDVAIELEWIVPKD